MNFLKKFGSRKLILSVLFGIGVPVLFQILGISETITLAGMSIGAAYMGANALVKIKTGSE